MVVHYLVSKMFKVNRESAGKTKSYVSIIIFPLLALVMAHIHLNKTQIVLGIMV